MLIGVGAWIVANALVYYAIEREAATSRTPNRRPSSTSLHEFQPPRVTSTMLCRVMPPVTVQRGRRYPLLVFLHGAGEKGDDNQSQLFGLPEQMAEPKWRERFSCFVLAPQCPAQSYWTNLDDELLSLIREVANHPLVDPERIYLTGLSMGGYGSWRLACREPELFAAVVPICGGGDPAVANRLVSVPIWAVHGDADSTVPVENTRKMILAIRQAGGAPRYSELPGVGHNSWTQTYRDPDGVLRWMFEQHRNPRQASSHAL